jgi:hypothetical protein
MSGVANTLHYSVFGSRLGGKENMTTVTVAFYTIGDTRHFQGVTRNTISDVYRSMARNIARYVFGVRTVDEAIQRIRGLAEIECISTIYFVGHGSGDGSFFFSGTGPAGSLEQFYCESPAQRLTAQSAGRLVAAVASRACSDTTLRMEFLACYAGGGNLITRLAAELGAAGISQYRVAGTRHWFQFEVDEDRQTGELTNWDNHLREHSGGTTERIPATRDPLEPHPGIIPGLEVVEEFLP